MRDLPAELRVWVFDHDPAVALVSFALSRCSVLTAAERDVARCASEGMSNIAIARRRGSSTRTVANQIANVLRKLRVGSRAELATLPEILA
jgi:DNA-binding CsgD family transcriptional regulator